MPRTLHKLNAAFVKKVVNLPTAERAALRPRRHSDGGNLYLSTKRGGAAFVFKYTQSGTRNSKEVPIGSAFSMTLTQAREKADALRKADGDVASAHQKAREAVLNQTTFGAYAVKVAPDLTRTLRHEKSRRAWLAALEKHAAPLWSMLLDAIEPHHVAECIRPIWIESRTTGDMVRRAIKDVLASAKARGLAHFASNPADMETMQAILGRRHDKKVNGREYQPYKKTPTTYKKLAARDRVIADAARFMILCGVRTIEVRRLTWGQFDIPSATWTVPADGEAKYKTGRATTIALSPAALAIIKKMQSGAQCQYVFNRKGKPLGQKAIIRELRACGVVETSHGFRSTVKVWGMKEAGYSAALMNKVLGHVHGDENETAADRAYAHSEAYLEERRPIMRAWAKYLGA